MNQFNGSEIPSSPKVHLRCLDHALQGFVISGCFLHALFVILVFARFVPRTSNRSSWSLLSQACLQSLPTFGHRCDEVFRPCYQEVREFTLHRVLHDAHEKCSTFSPTYRRSESRTHRRQSPILNDTVGRNNDTHAQHRVNDLSTLADLAPSHEKGG